MNAPEFTLADYQATAEVIKVRTQHRPTIGIILGSGLGALADSVESATIIPYADLPNWPHSAVLGHSNRLVIGTLQGKTVLVQQGRSHFYEGWSMAQVTYPVRVMQMLGIKTLVVTNAAGGINKSFAAGDLMLIEDHINFPGLGGQTPLRGPNDEALGTRFPDMGRAYDRELRALAQATAKKHDITLRDGVYCGLSGPSFESPAEIRMLRSWGADAVGMSTVWEVIVARHAGIRVLGFSGISNVCIDSNDHVDETKHEDVLAMGQKKIVPNLIALLRGVLSAM